MTHSQEVESPLSGASNSRPFIASYDLGYEFSQEQYIALQCMVEDETDEVETLTENVYAVENVA
jgi:hypothetical protein